MKTIISISLALCAVQASASNLSDSSAVVNSSTCRHAASFSQKLDRLSSTRLYQMTYIGVPLVVGGLIVKSEDDHFRNLRNDYLPHFRHNADDYIQLIPAMAMFGMKAFGVKGRSSWKRMLVSDAFSALVMGSAVNTIKLTTHVARPDGSNNRSFPSGHTATAFMAATMLVKEYGDKSPWIGIGAYTVATTTGLMRIANNKHWLSDVLTGAGIGVLSTEAGYYLADLIFKDKGMCQTDDESLFEQKEKPSFLSLYIGMNVPISSYDIDEQNSFRTSSGSSAGFEGAYFINPYLGFGGRFTVSNTAIITNGNKAEDNLLDAVSVACGGYFSYPVSSRWLIGSKLLAGYTHYKKLKLYNNIIPSRSGISFGSGMALTFRAKEHYGIRFFLDYNLLPPQSRRSHEWMNTLTLGSSFVITL